MRIWITCIVCLILTLITSLPIRAADEVLDGRLGGTLASFLEQYGDPTSGTPSQGADFIVPGYGTVFVQFKLAEDPDRPNRISSQTTPESPAMIIALSAPRDKARSATAADPNDWSLADVESAVRAFLPTGATMSEIVLDDSETTGSATCQSEAFASAYDGAPDSCRIAFVLPTPTTVSFVTLVLAQPTTDDAGPSNPCTGLAPWSRDAGARLVTAQATLGELAAVDETSPEAVAQLNDVASRFIELAEAQRSTETPPVAGRVRDLLIEAFLNYADASTAAADAVATGDDAEIDRAVDAIATAESMVSRATGLLQRALTSCGLESASGTSTTNG